MVNETPGYRIVTAPADLKAGDRTKLVVRATREVFFVEVIYVQPRLVDQVVEVFVERDDGGTQIYDLPMDQDIDVTRPLRPIPRKWPDEDPA